MLPGLDGSLGQLERIFVVAIKDGVIHPSVEVEYRELLLETGEDGLQEGLG